MTATFPKMTRKDILNTIGLRLGFYSLSLGILALFLFWIPEISVFSITTGIFCGITSGCLRLLAGRRIVLPAILGIIIAVLSILPTIIFQCARDYAFTTTIDAINQIGGHEPERQRDKNKQVDEAKSERKFPYNIMPHKCKSEIEDTAMIVLIRMGSNKGIIALIFLWLLSLSATDIIQNAVFVFNHNLSLRLQSSLAKEGYSVEYSGIPRIKLPLMRDNHFADKVVNKLIGIILGPLINPFLIGFLLYQTATISLATDLFKNGDTTLAIRWFEKLKARKLFFVPYKASRIKSRFIISSFATIISGFSLAWLVASSVTFDEIRYGSSRVDAYLLARSAVTKAIGSSTSPIFDSYFSKTVSVKRDSEGFFVVSGLVRTEGSPNETGKKYLCQVQQKDGKWKVISLQLNNE